MGQRSYTITMNFNVASVRQGANEAKRVFTEIGDEAERTEIRISGSTRTASNERTRLRVEEMRGSNRLEVERLKAFERRELEQTRIASRAALERARGAERAQIEQTRTASRAALEQARIAARLNAEHIRMAERASRAAEIARRKEVAEALKSAQEVRRIEEQTRRQAEQQQKLRERAAKSIADTQAREARRAADEYLSREKEMTRAAKQQSQAREHEAKRSAQVIQTFLIGAALAVSLAFGQFVNSSIQQASALRRQVANVASIKPEIDTSEVFKALREMQTRVPQTAEQLAESLYDTFSSINVTQAQGLQLIEKFARGATGAVTDAKTFGTAVIGVMNAYGKTVADVDHIQDVFFNTVKNGVVTGQELAASLGPATQAAKNAGVNFDELGALIAGVTKEGGPAAQNINNLANTLQKLPTKETQKALHDLKVETVDLQTGGFRPFLAILTDLKAKLDALPPAVRAAKLQEIFPDAQARTGLQTLLSQLGFIKEALRENETGAGSAGAAYSTMANTYAVAAALQENALRSFQLAVGDTIIQNAAWVKATEIVTGQINGQTDALNKAGTQTQIFANDFIIMLAKVKAQMIPFTGFVLQTVKLIGNALGLVLGSVVWVITRALEEIVLAIEDTGRTIINGVIRIVNGMESVLSAAGISGAIGVGGQIEYLPQAPRRNLGSDNVLKNLQDTLAEIPQLARSMKDLATEGRNAREEIDRAVQSQKRLRSEGGGVGDLRMAEAREAQKGAAVRAAEALAEEQRKRAAGASTVNPSALSAAMDDRSGRRRKAEKIIDNAEKWSVSELKEIQDFFRQATGKTLPVSVGQTPYHNKLGFDHRNAADVKLNPNSPEGKLLIQYLEQNQVPFRAFTGPHRNSKGVLTATGPHIHVGEPSSAFGKNTRSLGVSRKADDSITRVINGQVTRITPEMLYELQSSLSGVMDKVLSAPVEMAEASKPAAKAPKSYAEAMALSKTPPGVTTEHVLTSFEAARKAVDDQLDGQLQELYDRRMNLLHEYHDQWALAQNERERREMDYVVNIGRAEAELSQLRIEDANAATVANRQLMKVRQEELDLTQRLQSLQDDAAMMNDNAALRQQVALMEELNAIRRADVEAVESQIRSQARLADATVFHTEQSKAKVLEYLASQKSITELWADAKISVFQSTFDLIDRGLDRFTQKLGVAGDLVKQLLSGFARLALSKFFAWLETGGGAAGGGGASGGGFLSTLWGGIKGLFDFGRGGASATTPPFAGGSIPGLFAPSGIASVFKQGGVFSAGADFGPSLSAGAQTAAQVTTTLTDKVAKGSAGNAASGSLGGLLQNSGSLFRGIGFSSKAGSGGALAALLPLLGAGLGGSLVSGLAGPQAGGLANFMGMAGGALVGIGLSATPAIFAAGGSLASMGGIAGALFSNPFTAIAGAGLLIGGLILGKQKQRRADERARDASMKSSLKSLNDILQAVNAFPGDGGITVKDGLEQARQIKAQYLDAANSLKDKKARKHALLDVSRLESVISQIEAAGPVQKSRLEMLENRKPEFARGGVIPGRPGQPVEMVGHGQEVVVNWNQLTGLGAAMLALAGVPGLGSLPFSVPTVTPAGRTDSGGSAGGGGDIVVEELNFRFDNAGRLFVEGGKTRDGRRMIFETVNEVNYEGE